MTHTGFYSNERTFWHCTGVQALFLPLGEWVQPPTGSYGADTPDSKRRLVNLANASGLMRKLAVPDAAPGASREWRVILDTLRASLAASPDPVHEARAVSRWRSIATLKASVSTVMPRSRSASCVRSSGKP